MHSSKIIYLTVPINFFKPRCGNVEVRVIREVGRGVCDRHKVRGGRVGKPEESNGFGHLRFILCDFLLLRGKSLPAGSQVPAIRTEQPSLLGRAEQQ